jgi:RNA polymerase sigma-70 factor (ECF subfamily)
LWEEDLHSSEISDEELIERTLNGNDQALRQLHDRYIHQVFQYAYTQTGDYHRAEEVAQDIMYKMAVHLADFQGKSSFKTWLFAIGRRVVIDYHRKYGKEAHTLEVDSERLNRMAETDSVESKVMNKTLREQLLKGLQQLSVDDRTVIYLRFMEGLSLAETAQVMSRTTQAVKSLQHRAKKKLADLIGSEVKENGWR